MSLVNTGFHANLLCLSSELGRHCLLWILFGNWVSSINTCYLPTFLYLLSELGRNWLMNLAYIRMRGRHRELSSSPEWAQQTLTGECMKFCVTSKIIYNYFQQSPSLEFFSPIFVLPIFITDTQSFTKSKLNLNLVPFYFNF